MSKPDLRIVAAAPDVRTVYETVRDTINAQRISGALSEPEAVGARWAIDTIEAMQVNANRSRCEALIGCYLSEQITEDRWQQHLIHEPGLADMWRPNVADTEEKPPRDMTLAIEDACTVALRQLQLCQAMRTLNQNGVGPVPVLAVLVKVGEGASEFIDHLNAIRGSL